MNQQFANTRYPFLLGLTALCSIAMSVVATSAQEIPAAPQASPIVLTGGTIHTVSGKTIEDGEVAFENGLISAVGKKVERPKGAKTISVIGKHVYPGMFESHSQMGLTEIAAVSATNDFQETGTINPNVKALVSVYPDNVIIPVTRSNGVLFALTAPTGGLISGKSAVIQLDGWTYEDMSIKAEAAMHVNWPSQYISPRRRSRMTKDEIEKAEKQQQENLRNIRDLVAQARLYNEAKGSDDVRQKYDARLEAMIDVVEGNLPMMIRANRAADIQSAVAFADEQTIKIIILGGYDAEECAELLKQHNVPVIISAVYRSPQRRDDGYDKSYTLPARLKKAGVRFCISGTDRSETWNARTLPYHAGTAVGFGLTEEDAIKSITLYPAQILGVDDKIGSLEVGKHASMIVTDGSPLETTTQVEMAFLAGRKVDLSNRQKRLYKKYDQRQQQLKSAGE